MYREQTEEFVCGYWGLKGLIDKAWTTFRTDLQYCCLVEKLVHRSAVQELNNKLRR